MYLPFARKISCFFCLLIRVNVCDNWRTHWQKSAFLGEEWTFSSVLKRFVCFSHLSMAIDENTLKIPDMACLKTPLICLVLMASVKSSQVRPHNDKDKTPQKTKPKDKDNFENTPNSQIRPTQ